MNIRTFKQGKIIASKKKKKKKKKADTKLIQESEHAQSLLRKSMATTDLEDETVRSPTLTTHLQIKFK